jgi:molecular chaperone DnaK
MWQRIAGKAPQEAEAPAKERPKLQLLEDDYVAVTGRQETVVGIDFGTSYSSVALLGDGGLELVPIDGDVMMPSVVSFPAPGEVLVGAEARARLAGSAQWTVVSPKRLLGRLYKDQSAQRLFAGLAFRTFAGSDRYLRLEAHGQIYSAQDICAEILKVLRTRASEHLGQDVTSAVLAAPVGFGSLQRSALEQAARQAGLKVEMIVSEPTAAVLAQGFPSDWTGRIAVYDFGGGTFDFSVLEVDAESYRELCSGGDPWLGGDDFDICVAGQLADAFERGTQVDLRSRAVEWQKLIFAAESAKRQLSEFDHAEVRVDDLIITREGTKGLSSRVTTAAFEQLTAPLVKRSINVAERVLHQARLTPKDVDAVLMTGGTSLIPCVQRAVRELFGAEPVISEPHLAVVQGTAVQAAARSGADVARAVLRGRELHAVVGRTIGAGVEGGHVETIFERDTSIPATKRHRFFTVTGGEPTMTIRLYEQVTSRVDQSRPLGKVLLKGLRGLAAGEEYVDVTFTLGENGVLAVNATVDGRQYAEKVPTNAAQRRPLGPNHPAAGVPAGREAPLPEVKAIPSRAETAGQIDDGK